MGANIIGTQIIAYYFEGGGGGAGWGKESPKLVGEIMDHGDICKNVLAFGDSFLWFFFIG